ncbi:MAG: hypothetical protein RSE56_02050 [Bacilli bacterium]
MKTILVDFTSLVSGSDVASQGVKIFLHAHSDAIKLIIFGTESDLNTFDEDDNIKKLILTDDTTEVENQVLINALTNRADVYVGARDKNKLIPLLCESFAIPNTVCFPFTTFPLIEVGKRSLLSSFEEKDIPSIKQIVDETILYSKNILSPKEENMYLLCPSEHTDNVIYKNLNEELIGFSCYRGFIYPNQVLSTNSTIILSLNDDKDFLLNAINGTVSAYDTLRLQQTEKSFLSNIGTMLLKRTYYNIHARIDKTMTSNGIVYVGLKKDVVIVNSTTNCNGFAACLERGFKLISLKEKDAETKKEDK